MKKIALIAHDNEKTHLMDWISWNVSFLKDFDLIATGTTGMLAEKEFLKKGIIKPIAKMASGPKGGDQQLGAQVVEGKIGAMIFFWDPMDAHPHDPDVRALLRVAVLYNIPTACNKNTADFLISSPLFSTFIKE